MVKVKRKILLFLIFLLAAGWMFSGWYFVFFNSWILPKIQKVSITPTVEKNESIELINQRTYTSKTYANADGTYTLNAHVGQIHYEDKETKELKDIDTTLIDQGDSWTMDKASYHAEIPKYSNQPMIFQDVFEDKNQTIVMIPQTQPVQGEIENSDGWENKRVRYKNAYGENIDLRVTVGNIGLFKEVIVKEKPGKIQDLAFDFQLEIPKGKHLYLLDGKSGEIEKIKDLDNFELEGDDQLAIGEYEKDKESLSYIQKIRIWDSDGNTVSGKLRFYQKDGQTYFQKIIPQDFLRKASYPIYTDDTLTPIYSGAGDGFIDRWNGNTWNAVHDDTDGGTAYPTENTLVRFLRSGYSATSKYQITRGFFPVNTSALSASASINAASLNLYVNGKSDTDNDGNDFVSVVQTSQANSTTLTVADYDQCGAVHSPTEGIDNSERKDITSISTGAYLTFNLNSTGMSWVKKSGQASNCGTTAGVTCLGVREGHDIIDEAYVGSADTRNQITGAYSEYTGTSYDPYLSVTYTLPPDLTWVTGAADFEIWRSSDLTWDAGSLVCGGTLTDDNGETVDCDYLAVVPSTQYRVQMVLKNAGTGTAVFAGTLDQVRHYAVKGSSYWAGAGPTLGNCQFYDIGSDDTNSPACTSGWGSLDGAAMYTTTAGAEVRIATSGTEGFMYLITTDSSVPASSSASYAYSYLDAGITDSEDSSTITILGASGSQSVDIVDASGNSVSSPYVDFSTKDFSWNTQTSTGTFGISSQKVRATNGTTDETWSVNLAGSATTTTWTANSYHYDFNDDNGSGYTDGGDADNYGGQMTVDPSGGTVAGVPDNTSCPITNVSKGLSDSFVEGTTDSIDIFYGTSSSTVPCKWDFTGASITQKIPASQAAGSYSISMTLSIQ